MAKRAIQPSGLVNPLKNKKRDKTGLPWSQVILAEGKLVFISGQSPVDEKGNLRHEGNILKQTELALENLKIAVESAGGTLDDVVNTLWFTTSADKFYKEGASTLRRQFFNEPYPTSTLVEVSGFAVPGSMVEVQALAVVKENRTQVNPGKKPRG